MTGKSLASVTMAATPIADHLPLLQWAGASVVLAAIVAGIIALVGHLITQQGSRLTNHISRENARLATALTANVKLAEMRQAWINSLRNDMAEFQALAVTPRLEFQEKTEFYKLMARIELAMNPEDQDYQELSRSLYAYITNNSFEERRKNDVPYIKVCQNILKREWDVLKKEVQSVVFTKIS